MAVKIDGSDNRIACGTADIWPESSAWSLSLWAFKLAAGTNGRMIQKGSVLFYSDQGSGGDDLILEVDGTGANGMRPTTGGTFSKSVWTQFIVTFDGTTNASNWHIYKNGTEVSYGTPTNGLLPTDNATDTFFIGNRSDFLRGFNGYIDEVALYNAVINSASILALGTGRVKGLPLRVSSANLISYWPLEDVANGASGNGSTFRDRFGTNTGTGSNGTAGTGCTGTQYTQISYLLANDKSRGLARGVCRL